MKKRDAFTVTSRDVRGRATAAVRRAGRGAGFIVSAACLLALACAREPPRQVGIGQDIDVGPYAFRVDRARAAPNPPPPISTFRPQPGKKGIVVFVEWRTLDDDMEMLRRLTFIDSFIENQFSISDTEGRQTRPFGAMQASLMYMQDPGGNWRDWVAVFFVPEDSKGLTLLVQNPEPREGQARSTGVPLGI
jgi:hypothetical protein